MKYRLPLLMFILFLCACSRSPKHYNVIFISLDTTRGDYIDTGGIGGSKAFTPLLKSFSGKATVFDRAYSAIPQTLPSHLTMFTTYYPNELGVLSNEFKYDGRYKTLPEIFKDNKYRTAGIISLGTLASTTGFNRGFDIYKEKLNHKSVFFTPAETITRNALETLQKIKNNPFFMFVHYSDPHSPYCPPSAKGKLNMYLDGKLISTIDAYSGAILREQIPIDNGSHTLEFKLEGNPEDFEAFVFRRLQWSTNTQVTLKDIHFSKAHYNGSHVMAAKKGALIINSRGSGYIKLFQVIPLMTWRAGVHYYREEVEYMDRWVGEFLKSLEKEKLLKNTIVIIAGDHGEGLGERERYFGHVRYLNQQFLRVPLIMYFPGMKPHRFEQPVSLAWIAPAIVSYAGIDYPPFKNRENILTLTEHDDTPLPPVYSYAFKPSSPENKISIIKWPYQYIIKETDTGTPASELYNFALSPSFRKMDEYAVDVLKRNAPREYAFLQESIHRTGQMFLTYIHKKNKINTKEIENLKTIGYLQ